MAKLKKISKLFCLSIKCIEKIKLIAEKENMSFSETVEDAIMRRKIY